MTRRAIPAGAKLTVWVRSGGRCAICGKDLLDGSTTGLVGKLGELAHIVGQQDTAGSPRGESMLSAEERDQADNLMLLCAGEHTEIDRLGALDVMTVEKLQTIKREHEAWIHRMTGLDKTRGTAVLRMLGDVRGSAVELTKATCAAAVITCEDRFPDFPLAFDRYGVEIDLRNLPGEATGDPGYWAAATAKIDEVVAHKIRGALADGTIAHLSVFAFARLPLLVYLGARLDDTTPISIYERHRRTQDWVWPATGSPAAFTFEKPPASALGGEAVLVMNVSGSIQPDEIPAPLADLPRYTLTFAGAVPSTEVIDSPAALAAFARATRELLATIEATSKNITRLHLLAALPISAAIEIGRAHAPHVHPALAVYDRGPTGYIAALELS